MKNGLYLRAEYQNALKLLSDTERGQLLLCLFDIVKNGQCNSEDLTSDGKLALAFIGDAIRRDREEYLAKCDANRQNAAKRWSPRGKEPESPEG